MVFADEVTILRRGKLAGQGHVKDLSPDAMARMMIGAEELTVRPPRSGEFGAPRLNIEKLNALDDGGQPAVRDVSLSIRGGEIVGVAGVSGNGQRQLIEVLAGQRDAESGRIFLQGEEYHATRAEMRHNHLSVLPEEPLKNACVARMSVADNLAFREFDRVPFASGGWWLNGAQFHDNALRKIERYKIKTRSDDTPIGELSGGNVQRTVLARELAGEVDILVAANPCFGLDFAAVAQIHAEIVAARNRGAAVLLVSEDLDELLELADRLVVMFHGEIVYELRSWSEADYHAAAAVITTAYRGHVDAEINDQYRTLTGSLRFLNNIVRFPGCGTFDPEGSFVAVHKQSKSLVGLILCSRVRHDVGHITQVCVLPEFRQHGLGEALIDCTTGNLRKRNFSMLSLTVTEANVRAVELYLRLGFEKKRIFDAFVWEG